jgi:hypothetical protein
MFHHGRATNTGDGRHRTAIQGKPGYPDFTIVHPAKRIAMLVELKRFPNQVEDDQLDWWLGLVAAGVDARIWWVPEDLDELVQAIAARRIPHPRPLVEQLAGPANDPRRGHAQRLAKAAARIETHPTGKLLLTRPETSAA